MARIGPCSFLPVRRVPADRSVVWPSPVAGAGTLWQTAQPMEEQQLARGIAIGRIAVGVSALFTTKLFTLIFAGREPAEDQVTKMAGRLFAIRDIAIGLALLDALDHGLPVRRLLQLGMMCDLTDTVVVLVGYRALPVRGRILGLALAGGFAAAGMKALSPANA
jgi:hypothetical protein